MTDVRTGEDPTKAILSESALNEKHLCDYVINVATGCRHGCKFCYVPGTPNIRTRGEMLADEADVDDGQDEWGEYVLYRDDIPERLPGILDRKRTWRETEQGQGIVGISFHTDCFMDKRAGDITAAVVETLAEHDRHARILTRNPLLASSYMDTFREAGEYVTVGTSIPTLTENYVDAIEPNAPSIEARLEGLHRFADAGVPVYVSMSPTYPTIDTREDMEALLTAISVLDPSVVFHEPINPRGKNFEMTCQAAMDGGWDGLTHALSSIRDPNMWIRYACTHFAWVQEISNELDLPLHLWPDKQLIEEAAQAERRWLQRWRDRQSPEPFGGRPTPDASMPSVPSSFTWEEQQELPGGAD